MRTRINKNMTADAQFVGSMRKLIYKGLSSSLSWIGGLLTALITIFKPATPKNRTYIDSEHRMFVDAETRTYVDPTRRTGDE